MTSYETSMWIDDLTERSTCLSEKISEGNSRWGHWDVSHHLPRSGMLVGGVF